MTRSQQQTRRLQVIRLLSAGVSAARAASMTGLSRWTVYWIARNTAQGGARALRKASGRRPTPVPDDEEDLRTAVDALGIDILAVLEGETLEKIGAWHGTSRQAVDFRLKARTGMGARALRALARAREGRETHEQLARRLAWEGYMGKPAAKGAPQ